MQGADAISASTSARDGAPSRPPKRVHLMAAAALAKRAAVAIVVPSASASVNAPCQTSPAASVSTAVIAGAPAPAAPRPPSRQRKPSGAERDADDAADAPRRCRRKPSPGAPAPARVRDPGSRERHVGGAPGEVADRLGRADVAVEDRRARRRRGRRRGRPRRRPASARRRARREAGDPRERQPRRVGVEARVVVGADQALAVVGDQDRGRRRNAAGNPAHGGRVDAFGRELGQDPGAQLVVADPAPVMRGAAQPGDGDAGVGRHAAAALGEPGRQHLGRAVGMAGTR